MATVAALFGSQLEADKAVSALATRFEDINTRVFENVGGDPAEPDVGYVAGLESSRITAATNPSPGDWFSDLDDEALADFFFEGVRHGGVLVVAETDEARMDDVQALFEEHGGRTSAES